MIIPTTAWNGRGYCAPSGETFFVGVALAVGRRDFTGPFHPNSRGHDLEASYNIPAVCEKLYGNPTCSGTARR